MGGPALRCIAHVSPPLAPMLLREPLRLHQFDGNGRIVRGGTFCSLPFTTSKGSSALPATYPVPKAYDFCRVG